MDYIGLNTMRIKHSRRKTDTTSHNMRSLLLEQGDDRVGRQKT